MFHCKKESLTGNFAHDYAPFTKISSIDFNSNSMQPVYYLMLYWNTFMPVPIHFYTVDIGGFYSVTLTVGGLTYTLECAFNEYHGQLYTFNEFLKHYVTVTTNGNVSDVFSVPNACDDFLELIGSTECLYSTALAVDSCVTTMDYKDHNAISKHSNVRQSLLDAIDIIMVACEEIEGVCFSDADAGVVSVTLPAEIGLTFTVSVGSDEVPTHSVSHCDSPVVYETFTGESKTVGSIFGIVPSDHDYGTLIRDTYIAQRYFNFGKFGGIIPVTQEVPAHRSCTFSISDDFWFFLFPFAENNKYYLLLFNGCAVYFVRRNNEITISYPSTHSRLEFVRGFLICYISLYSKISFSKLFSSVVSKYVGPFSVGYRFVDFDIRDVFAHKTLLGISFENYYMMGGKCSSERDHHFIKNLCANVFSDELALKLSNRLKIYHDCYYIYDNESLYIFKGAGLGWTGYDKFAKWLQSFYSLMIDQLHFREFETFCIEHSVVRALIRMSLYENTVVAKPVDVMTGKGKVAGSKMIKK